MANRDVTPHNLYIGDAIRSVKCIVCEQEADKSTDMQCGHGYPNFRYRYRVEDAIWGYEPDGTANKGYKAVDEDGKIYCISWICRSRAVWALGERIFAQRRSKRWRDDRIPEWACDERKAS